MSFSIEFTFAPAFFILPIDKSSNISAYQISNFPNPPDRSLTKNSVLFPLILVRKG